MSEKVDGFEYLEKLRDLNGKNQQNFREFSKYLDQKAREKGVPIRGQFELTPLCNLNCKMCYVQLTPDQMSGRPLIPVSVWKDLIRQAWEAGMLQVSLTGGECLAYPGFEEIFLFAHSLGCEIYVLTNGILLDDKRIRFFQEHEPAIIKVSLYGWNEDVYERVTGKRVFHTVEANIRKAIAAELPIRISITPSTYLGEDVLDTIRLAKSICDNIDINSAISPPREETGRSKQMDDPDVELYVKAYKLNAELKGRELRTISADHLPRTGGAVPECVESGLRCGGGRSGFVIDWKGTMMPCNGLDMICSYPINQGFVKAWTDINKGAESWPRVPECESCAYRHVCDNCAANMLRFAKPGELSTELCKRTQAYVCNGICRIPDCE